MTRRIRYLGPYITRVPGTRPAPDHWFVGWRLIAGRGDHRVDVVGTLTEILQAAHNHWKAHR